MIVALLGKHSLVDFCAAEAGKVNLNGKTALSILLKQQAEQREPPGPNLQAKITTAQKLL